MPRKSISSYPADWLIIARQVKDRAGWCCVRCGHPHAPAEGYTLTVHHLTMDPANNRWWNLAALCQRCHLTIQARVVMERTWFLEQSDWFKPHAAGYYAHVFGLPDDREFVEAHVDELIAIGQGRMNVEELSIGGS
jgi:5-methylcytosine-specific restriction endonuclease McrA